MPFDFAAVTAPFRMQPGLRRLAPGCAQLTPIRPGDRHFVEKSAVLAARAGEALVTADGFEPGAAVAALCAHAAQEQPRAWEWDGEHVATAPWLGCSVRRGEVHSDAASGAGALLQALPPQWRLPGLLSLAFAEDFAVLDGDTGRIPWLAVCLPSHWSPEDKVGRHFAEVHAPVADNQLLINASDHLTRLATGPDRWERFVWTLTREPRLRMHPRHLDTAPWPVAATAEELAAQTYFRSERQTFIPVTGRRQAVFTIHVESRPLEEAVSSPHVAHQLHGALASMSPAVLAYRGLTDARDRLLAWLARRAAESLP
jgi:hypothetical protein